MDTGTVVLISTVLFFATVLVIVISVRRSAREAREANRQGEILDYLRERDRERADADRETRAANFYTMKIAMETVQRQAVAQSQTAVYTAQALANAVDGLKADRKALETLETRAVVDAYTKLLQTQKKEAKRIAQQEDRPKEEPKQKRYWEEVDYYV